MNRVTALGLYVFSATSSTIPTAASKRMSRAVSGVRSFVYDEGDQAKYWKKDIHTYQELIHACSLRQLLGANLRISFST